MEWFLSNDPNNSTRGLTQFLLYLWKKVWTIQQPETESNWKYYAQHAQKLNQEGTAINSSELAN